MNELKLFNYDGIHGVRVMDGKEPMFVARDLCEILELGDTSKAVSRLPETMKGTNSILTPGGIQEMLTVTEAGMYKLVFTSRKREAEKFTDWLATDVIPAIRKHGAYMTADTIEKTLTDPDYLIRLATTLKEERDKRIAAERQIETDKPKVEFFDQVADSKDAVDLGTAARVLNMGIGRNRLFEILRDNKILMDNNQPYQKYIDRGYFRTVEQKYTKPDGTTCISIKTLVYQRGLDYIRKILLAA